MATFDPNLPVQSIFEYLGYNVKQIESFVPRMAPAYDRPVVAKLLDYFPNAVKIKSKQRPFTIARQGNDYPAYAINTRTASGSNLVLGITSNVTPRIGVGNIVAAQNGTVGKVLSISQGSVTVKLQYSPVGNSSFASTDFVVGQMFADRGNVGNTQNRRANEYQLEVPDPFYNTIGTIDLDVHLTHDDFNSRTWLDNSDGVNLYALQKEIQAMQRLKQWEYSRMYTNIGADFDGVEPIGASLLNQIITMGGLNKPLSGAVTEDFLIGMFRDYKKNGGSRATEVSILAGGQAAIDIGVALKGYVTTAGDTNVVGGKEVKGIAITTYAVPGFRCNVMEEPLWSNPLVFPDLNNTYTNMSGSMLLFDTTPALTEEGQSVPFMLEYYYGKDADIVTWETPGLYNRKGERVPMGTSQKDCVVHFTWDKQYQWTNPSNCIWMPRS